MRVLDAGRGPERPLERGAGLAKRGEPLAEEDLLEACVGGARVDDARSPLKLLAAERVEPLVALGVDP